MNYLNIHANKLITCNISPFVGSTAELGKEWWLCNYPTSQFPKVLNKPNFMRLFAMYEGVGFVDETSFIVLKAFLQKTITPLGKS